MPAGLDHGVPPANAIATTRSPLDRRPAPGDSLFTRGRTVSRGRRDGRQDREGHEVPRRLHGRRLHGHGHRGRVRLEQLPRHPERRAGLRADRHRPSSVYRDPTSAPKTLRRRLRRHALRGPRRPLRARTTSSRTSTSGAPDSRTAAAPRQSGARIFLRAVDDPACRRPNSPSSCDGGLPIAARSAEALETTRPRRSRSHARRLEWSDPTGLPSSGSRRRSRAALRQILQSIAGGVVRSRDPRLTTPGDGLPGADPRDGVRARADARAEVAELGAGSRPAAGSGAGARGGDRRID